MSYTLAAKALREAHSVTLTTHLNPDGDGIGSCLALFHALEKAGKTVRFACPSKVASLYAYLPGFARMEIIAEEPKAMAQEPVDVVLSCDCGDLARLGACARLARKTLINLDHHASNTRFGDINLVIESGESSGVVVDILLSKMKLPMNPAIAACLYTTIVFDTGRFMHSNTTPRALRSAARWLAAGVDAGAINRALTYTKSPNDLNVQRLGLEKLNVDDQVPALAGIALDAAAIATVGAPEDWGDLVDLPRSLRGNRVAYLLREAPDKRTVRCSLRSNPPWSVMEIAQQFGGGGHRQAAGCTVPGDLATVLPALLPQLRAAAGADFTEVAVIAASA